MVTGDVTMPIWEYEILQEKAKLIDGSVEYIRRYNPGRGSDTPQYIYSAVTKDKILEELKAGYEEVINELRNRLNEVIEENEKIQNNLSYRKPKPTFWQRLFK